MEEVITLRDCPLRDPLAGCRLRLDSNWHSPAVVKNVVSFVLTNFDSGIE
jgi:hypothetical protein